VSRRSAIESTPDLDLPDPKTVPVALPLLVEEAKNGCTMGMLLCLDRKQRLIFTLGAILGASDTVGGEVLEMTTDNFRQCLARARRARRFRLYRQPGPRPAPGSTSACR